MSTNGDSRARPEREVLTTTDIAGELGISVYTVRRLIREGRIRKLGGLNRQALITRAAFDDYLNGQNA